MKRYICSIARPTNTENQNQAHAGFMGMRIVVTQDDQVFVCKEPHIVGIDTPVNCGGGWEEFRIEKRWGETTATWLERMGAKPATFKDQPHEDYVWPK